MADQRSTLPARRGRLIGRLTDLEAVRARLLGSDRRLLTLTGAGGTGKTRLALEAARQVEPLLADGAWFVDLSLVRADASAEEIALACAAALGIVNDDRSPPDALARHLAVREALLILDNCEHVAPAAANVVDDLLDRCHDLRILATSRAALRVRDEFVYPVPPLPVPAGDVDFERLARNEAIQLFVERATAAAPSFQLMASTAPAVASICRRLDGIPLAIELAAVLSATLSPNEIDEQLTAQGSLIEGGGPGPERQRTMEAAICWSYDLLDPAAQTLFRRLAVFAGGWSLEAAERIGLLDTGSEPVVASLARLVEHSLVIHDGSESRSRYRMLAPIADYAAERLASSGELAATSIAHATYFLELSRSPHASVGQCLPEDLDRLALEHANCLVAMRFAEKSGNVQLRLGILLNLIMLWRVRGQLHLAVRQLEAALGQVSDASSEQASILGLLAEFGHLLGDYDQAEARAREAEATFAKLGNPVGERAMMAQLGMVAAGRGDYAGAIAEFERAQPLVEAVPDGIASGYWHAGLGRFHLALANLDAAERHLERARAGFEEQPTWYIGHVLAMLGSIERLRGQPERAFGLLAAGIDSLHRYGATVEAIACLEEMARLAIDRRQDGSAATLFAAATGLRDATAAVASVSEREQRTAGIEHVRSKLAADDFEAAWSDGLGMSLEQAVTFALTAPSAIGWRRAAPKSSALTRREREIAQLVSLGLTNREIASRLVIAPGTVKVHVERILGKLGRTSRVQVATWALEERERSHKREQATGVDARLKPN